MNTLVEILFHIGMACAVGICLYILCDISIVLPRIAREMREASRDKQRRKEDAVADAAAVLTAASVPVSALGLIGGGGAVYAWEENALARAAVALREMSKDLDGRPPVITDERITVTITIDSKKTGGMVRMRVSAEAL